MTRPNDRIVSGDELRRLFEELHLWAQIRDGRLSTTVLFKRTVPSKSFPGAFSQILVHHDSQRIHRCTTHRIIDADGNVLHWDEADIKLEGGTITKAH